MDLRQKPSFRFNPHRLFSTLFGILVTQLKVATSSDLCESLT